MIVLRIPVIMLVDRPATQDHLVQQARIHHFGKRPIDSRPTDLASIGIVTQIQQQLICIKMLMPAGNLLDNNSPLLRNSLSLGLQKLLKPLKRRESNFDSTEGKVVRHSCHSTREL